MNYWRRYSGSYLKKTPTLNLTEHGAYTLLLDYYYTEERPLSLDHDELYLMVRAMRPDDKKAVDKVLRLYFTKGADGYHNERADHEISVSKKARENGKGGGRPITGEVTGSQTGILTRDETETITRGGGGSVHPLALSLKTKDNLQPKAATSPSTDSQGQNPSQTAQKPRRSAPENGSSETRTATTWEAYSEAYQGRYGVPPVRNATVNGQLAQFVKRIGAEESPSVARFYLSHSKAFYVGKKHAVGVMLQDAEGLRTEWATGRTVTDTEARQADRTQATGGMFKRMIDEVDKAS